MIQKETHQPDNTAIIENFVTLSREHKITAKVQIKDDLHQAGITYSESSYSGILMDIVIIYAATIATDSFLYLRNTTGQGTEMHRLINTRHIESISFETEKGFLDNLLE